MSLKILEHGLRGAPKALECLKGAWRGVAMSPAAAVWFVVQDGNAVTGTDSGIRPFAPDDAFEIRAFDGTSEFRWWHEEGGRGRAVTIQWAGEQDHLAAADSEWLLWGKTIGSVENGWIRLGEARVGSFWIPSPSPKAPRSSAQVKLVARTFTDHDDHGNTTIVEELLTELRWV